MSTTGDVHVGDVGTTYKAKIQDAGVPFDASAATAKVLIFRPPRKAAFTREATVTTDGTDWYLEYTLEEGTDDDFHATPGLWKWQGYVEFADGQKYHTNKETYVVERNIN